MSDMIGNCRIILLGADIISNKKVVVYIYDEAKLSQETTSKKIFVSDEVRSCCTSVNSALTTPIVRTVIFGHQRIL